MKTTKHTELNRPRTLVATAVALILVVAWTAWTAGPVKTQSVVAAQPQAVKEQAAHSRRAAASGSEQQVAELRRQLDILQAKPTDRGLVVTLGDVLFTSGKADLQTGATGNLNKLVAFLVHDPARKVAIRGYTDNLGSEEYNQGLSERRANSVKAYLAAQGIDSTRLSASGMGQSDPVAGNDSGAGRQQNRRVELIITDPPAALPQRTRTAKMLMLLVLLQSVTGSPGRPLL